MNKKIAIIGLGYVGLPLLITFAKKFNNVIGFDINIPKILDLQNGIDITGEVNEEDLKKTKAIFTSSLERLMDRDFFIVAVPTPIDKANRPDLGPVISASECVGKVLKKGSIVVYESTVYPGVTEEICVEILSKVSGLKAGVDFKVGYSPERINPGDKEHSLENITKIISGQDEESLDIIEQIYGCIIEAGVYRAPCIKVAEAAKVIENIQRDLNIAFMNELAIIFNKLNIRTSDVLAAAGTKWNFIPFRPGLVGGHCIGVDPYYLTYKAEELGYIPQVILAGRRINNSMGKYIAEQTVKYLASFGKNVHGSRVGILGLTFKENVPDLRNSRVPDILVELKEYGIKTIVHDPYGDKKEAMEEYGIELEDLNDIKNLDAIILAVGHDSYIQLGVENFISRLKNKTGIFIDVKSIFSPHDFPKSIKYWSL